MRLKEQLELMEAKIRKLEEEVEALKGGTAENGEAEAEKKTTKTAAKAAAPKAKKATSK